MKQVPLVPDQRAVEHLAAAGQHPSFHEPVRSRHLDTAEHHLDPRILEHGIEEG